MKLIKEVIIRDGDTVISIPAGTELEVAVDQCMRTFRRERGISVVDVNVGEKSLRFKLIPGLKVQCYQSGWTSMDDDLVLLNLEFFLRREGWMRPVADASECPRRANI